MPSNRHDERRCEQCRCDHDFRPELRFIEPPPVMLVTIASATLAEKVSIPLSFTALIADGRLVDYHLVSFVRMIDFGRGTRHFVALVHRNKRCKSWTCYDDEAVSPAVVLKVEDGWLRDTVRMAFYVAVR